MVNGSKNKHYWKCTSTETSLSTLYLVLKNFLLKKYENMIENMQSKKKSEVFSCFLIHFKCQHIYF